MTSLRAGRLYGLPEYITVELSNNSSIVRTAVDAVSIGGELALRVSIDLSIKHQGLSPAEVLQDVVTVVQAIRQRLGLGKKEQHLAREYQSIRATGRRLCMPLLSCTVGFDFVIMLVAASALVMGPILCICDMPDSIYGLRMHNALLT
jgi:hypothetical protein